MVVGCALAPTFSLAAPSETPAAFDGRCIPAAGVASSSHIPDILSRRAVHPTTHTTRRGVASGRLARLGATLDFHYGLLAQQDQGVITGRVTDASGAVLPGATVIATRVATGVTSQTMTSTEGLYTIPALPVGSYRVVAELAGFKRTVREAIDVHAQTRVRVDFQLELGTLEESITVVAAAAVLQSDTSSLTHVLKEAEIRELPLNGRNFQQLAVLAGGVLPAFGHRDREGGFNSHGQWATQNNFILDGVDNNSQVLVRASAGAPGRRGALSTPTRTTGRRASGSRSRCRRGRPFAAPAASSTAPPAACWAPRHD